MDIAIIGSGWLALPLATKLNKLGHNVSVSTTTIDKCQALNNQGFNAHVHHIGALTPPTISTAQVIIFANTCKNIIAYKKQVDDWQKDPAQQVIFTSSTAVYQENGAIHNEDSTALNKTHPTYLIEQLLKTLNVTCIRLAGLVGPNRHPGRFFKHGKIPNGHCPVNLLHLDDATGIICAVIEQQVQNEIINACADNHPKKAAFYKKMAHQLGRPDLTASNTTNSLGKTISNSKSKQLLNYSYLYPDVWQMDY